MQVARAAKCSHDDAARRARRAGYVALAVAALAGLSLADGLTVHATPSSQLTRYPYLTDDAGSHATLELATAQNSTVTLTYGLSPGCSGSSVTGSGTSFAVSGATEYQYTLKMTGLLPASSYCYSVSQNGANLLGSDPTPSFVSALPSGSPTSFSFVVFGDWGSNPSGTNAPEAALMQLIHSSGASFGITVGDNSYNDGSQTNYGDYVHTGANVSNVFGPQYWAQNGASMPLFAGVGNHGFSNISTIFLNWNDTSAAADSSGVYAPQTYSGKDGTSSTSYPSAWYAFDWGEARFYMLTASWSDANLGSGSLYKNDYDYHWAAGSAELQWLQNDLTAHASTPAKFAIFHFPLHADNSGQPSDTYLDGPSSLEGLLANNKVTAAFNGHAHIYERNLPQVGSMASYVTGGGGAPLGSVSGCSSFDAYALGSGSSCHAPAPTSQNQVFHYLLVTVNGSQVTVAPTNANGVQFDVQRYSVGSIVPGQATHFAVSAPSSATAGSSFQATVTALDGNNNTATAYQGSKTLTWSGLSNAPGGAAPTYPANPITFNNGVAAATITPYAAQTAPVTAGDGSISGTSGSIGVKPGPAAALLPAAPASPAAGTSFSEKVTALDSWGNTATGFTGAKTMTWSGPGSAPNGSAAPAYPASLTFSSGAASGSMTLVNAQTTQLTASTSGLNGMSSVFTVVGGATTALAPQSPGSATAGVMFGDTVNAVDKYGNISPGFAGAKTLTWSGASNSPNGRAPSYQSSVTFTKGIGIANTTLYKAQSLSLTVKTGSTTVLTGTSPAFSVAPGAPSTLALASPGAQTAGIGFNETLTAFDAYGNAATNFNGSPALTWSGPSSSPNGTAPRYPSSVTFSNGVGVAPITLYDAQTLALKAAQGALTGTSPNFSVGPASASALALATPSSPSAGAAFSDTVTALDAWANVATSYAGSRQLTWGGPGIAPDGTSSPSYPAAVTFSGGTGSASITLFNSESTTLSVSDGAHAGSSGSFFVKPAAASTLSVATPGQQTAGEAFAEYATAYDPYRNVATGYHGTVTFSGPHSAPDGTPPTYSSVTFSNGVGAATITLTDAEDTALTAADASSSSIRGASGTFTVIPGPTAELGVDLASPVTQALPDNTGQVSAFDAYRNLVMADSSSLSLASPDTTCGAHLTCPPIVALVSGQATFSFGFSDCGTQTLTLSEAGSGGVSGTGDSNVQAASPTAGCVPTFLRAR